MDAETQTEKEFQFWLAHDRLMIKNGAVMAGSGGDTSTTHSGQVDTPAAKLPECLKIIHYRRIASLYDKLPPRVEGWRVKEFA